MTDVSKMRNLWGNMKEVEHESTGEEEVKAEDDDQYNDSALGRVFS